MGHIKPARFLKHVKDSGGILYLIAQRIGVTREGLYGWLNRNPEFWEHVYSEREKIIDIAETKLVKKIQNEEDWAIKFVLSSTNRGRQRGYSERAIEFNAVKNEQNNNLNIGLTKEEYQRLLEVL